MATPQTTTTVDRETITLPVEGMTCAACQAHVSRALNDAPGVERASVNLMTNEATVVYDPRLASPTSLVAAVEATGYSARVPAPEAESSHADEARDAEHAREARVLLTKALVSLGIGLVAMLVSMPLMGGGAHGAAHTGDPLVTWTMRVIDPPDRKSVV